MTADLLTRLEKLDARTRSGECSMKDWVTCEYCKADTHIDDEVIEQIEAQAVKRCVSILVARALEAKRVGWVYFRNHGACWGWKDAQAEAKYFMQAAREIMPKARPGSD